MLSNCAECSEGTLSEVTLDNESVYAVLINDKPLDQSQAPAFAGESLNEHINLWF